MRTTLRKRVRARRLQKTNHFRDETMKHPAFMRILILTLCMAVTASCPSWAVDPSEKLEHKDYGQAVGRKLQRGASNIAFGWVEIPAGISEIGNKHGVGAAATWGVVHGVGRAIQRTAVGIFEVITFPVGLPQNFEPIIEPEYVLGQDNIETAEDSPQPI